MNKTAWVCRDLSNGNGAEGTKRPTYIWAYNTRAQARRQFALHAAHPAEFANLSRPEKWSWATITRYYKRVSDFNYFQRPKR